MSVPRYLSPLRYPGGKAKMAAALAQLMAVQHTGMDVEVWMEPFAGGAGAGLGVLEAGTAAEVWLVELNPALATFWQVAVREGDSLASLVERETPTVARFVEAKESVARAIAGDLPDPMRLALDTFLVNRCSRSGMIHGSVGPIGGWEQDGRHRITDRWNASALAERLRRIGEHGARGHIRVHHADAIHMISELRGSGIEDELFLFVDPPYLREGNRLYAKGMTDSLHDRLAVALRDCPSPWLLTYDDEPAVADRLYSTERVLAYRIANTANMRRDAWEHAVLADHLHLDAGGPPPLLPGGETKWVRNHSG